MRGFTMGKHLGKQWRTEYAKVRSLSPPLRAASDCLSHPYPLRPLQHVTNMFEWFYPETVQKMYIVHAGAVTETPRPPTAMYTLRPCIHASTPRALRLPALPCCCGLGLGACLAAACVPCCRAQRHMSGHNMLSYCADVCRAGCSHIDRA